MLSSTKVNWGSAAFAVCLASWSTLASGLTPSQLPLLSQSGSPPVPNLMITIDDSLSMDGIGNPGNITSPFVPGNRSLGFSPDEEFSRVAKKVFFPTTTDEGVVARVRSQLNRIYYNPEFRYEPWKKSDGTSMADADPKAAWLDPIDTWRGTTDLVSTQDFSDKKRRWCTTTDCTNQTLSDFEPDVYFVFVGSNTYDIADYQRIRISDYASFVRGSERTDCTAIDDDTRNCSTAQEHQNFANWYVYYRTRMLLATAALANTFATQSDDIRLGYGRTNKYESSDIDGISAKTIERGVRQFTGSDRDDFFDWVYAFDTTCCTPLRRAVDDIGQYFKRADDRGPWSETPGVSGDNEAQLSCRKNYSILITDGAWTNHATLEDAASGAAAQNVDGTTGPLIVSSEGETYQYTPAPPFEDVRNGMLADVAMYYWNRDLRPNLPNNVQPDAANPAFWQHVVQFTIGLGVTGQLDPLTDLPSLTSGSRSWNSNKLDDLWHAAINGRGSYFSADDPNELSEAISGLLTNIAERDATEAGPALSGTSLEAGTKKFIPTYRTRVWSGDITASNLDASGLTTSTLWRASEELPAWERRNIVLSRGATGGAWTFNSASVPEDIASAISEDYPAETIRYLRGDSSLEGVSPYDFRVRDSGSLIGDVVNSSPVMFGVDDSPQYQYLPTSSPGANTYREYLIGNSDKQQTVFFGANDGMLHALNADNGEEVFAMIPEAVVENLGSLADASYTHQFFVDGPLKLSNAYDSSWKTVLTGTTGAGAKSIFAIDVTDPESLDGNDVLWELNSRSTLGYVTQPVQVGVLSNGTWVAVSGNGIGSASGTATLLILDLFSGTILAEVSVPGTDNGLGGVRLITDTDNVIAGVYAGDQLGRVWRFEPEDGNPLSWEIGFDGSPLFEMPAQQPINAPPAYVDHPEGGQLVLVGSGRLIAEADRSTTDTEYLYGLWDKVPAIDSSEGQSGIEDESQLVTQTIGSAIGDNFATSSSYTLDWQRHRGWKMELTIVSGLRLLTSPVVVRGAALFQTVTPIASSGDSTYDACTPASQGVGYNILVNVLYGSQFQDATLDTNSDGKVDESDAPASLQRVSADGGDAILLGRNGLVSLQSSSGNSILKLPGRPMERTWRQIINYPR